MTVWLLSLGSYANHATRKSVWVKAMSTDATTERETRWAEIVPVEVPLPPSNLVFDDGEPLETNRHRIAMNVLIDSAQGALSGREDFFVGGNMFVYYSSVQAMKRDFRGPDFFVVMDIDGSRDV